MTFCCGASMIGSIGSVHTENIFVDDLPILYCPVCKSIQVHPLIEDEYHILIEFAEGDHASAVVFSDYVDLNTKNLRSVCISWDEGDHEVLLREQIDNALDLLVLAKECQDEKWEVQLKIRLKILSASLNEWLNNKSLYA